jgi:hypothetical protein
MDTSSILEGAKTRRIAHPFYRSDIILLNLVFFGHTKREMSKWIGRSTDELITKVGEMIQSIGQEIILSVNEEWIKKLEMGPMKNSTVISRIQAQRPASRTFGPWESLRPCHSEHVLFTQERVVGAPAATPVRAKCMRLLVPAAARRRSQRREVSSWALIGNENEHIDGESSVAGVFANPKTSQQ